MKVFITVLAATFFHETINNKLTTEKKILTKVLWFIDEIFNWF